MSPTIHLEDEKLVSQLAALQDMHDQIYHLRSLPQALLRPVSEILGTHALPLSHPSAPSKIYASFQKVAVEGLRDVENFKQSWLSEESQTLWNRTNVEDYPPGDDAWRVDYISALKRLSADEQRRAAELPVSATDSLERSDILKSFREKHPLTDIESQDPATIIPLNMKVAGMTFRIVSINVEDEAKYEVQYTQDSKSTKLQDMILEQLLRRQAKGNLEYLLDMLVSYEDVEKYPCNRCHKVLDKALAFPVIRKPKQSTVKGDEDALQWEALHESCA